MSQPWFCPNCQGCGTKNEEINELLKNKHVFPLELGRSIGWESYLGRLTKTFSIDTFGESAPIEDLEKNFGFDIPSITKEIIKYLNQQPV